MKIKIVKHMFSVDDLIVRTDGGKIILPLRASTATLLGDRLEDFLSLWARNVDESEELYIEATEKAFVLELFREEVKNAACYQPVPFFTLSNAGGRVSLDVWEARRLLKKIRNY